MPEYLGARSLWPSPRDVEDSRSLDRGVESRHQASGRGVGLRVTAQDPAKLLFHTGAIAHASDVSDVEQQPQFEARVANGHAEAHVFGFLHCAREGSDVVRVGPVIRVEEHPELIVVLQLVSPLRLVVDGLESIDDVPRRGQPVAGFDDLDRNARHLKGSEVLLGGEGVLGGDDEPRVVSCTAIHPRERLRLSWPKEAHGDVTLGIAPKRPSR